MKIHDCVLLSICGVLLCVAVTEYQIIKKKEYTTVVITHQNSSLSPEKPTEQQMSDTNYVNYLLSEVNTWRTSPWIYYETNNNQIYIQRYQAWLMLKMKSKQNWNLIRAGYYISGLINAGYYRRLFDGFPMFVGIDAGYNYNLRSADLGLSILLEW